MSSLTSTADLTNFVNGRRTDARGSESIDLVDPATEEVYATAPVSTEEDVVLVTGSLYVAGAARSALEGRRD